MKGSLTIFLSCGAVNSIDVTKEEADKIFSAVKRKKRFVELSNGTTKTLWKTEGITGLAYVNPKEEE